MNPTRTPALRLLALAAVLLSLAAPATAQRRAPADDTRLMHIVTYGSTSSPAAVAGTSSSDVVTRGASASGTTAIEGLRWGERGDEPCWIFVGTVSNGSSWDGCGASSYNTQRTLAGGDHLVGVAVCTNNRNDARGDLVKGVRAVWAEHPERRQTAQRNETTHAAEMPNCANWSATVRCGPGTAASRLRIHHISIGGRRGIVGLQLDCADLEEQCWEVSPGVNDDVLTAVPILRCRALGQEP